MTTRDSDVQWIGVHALVDPRRRYRLALQAEFPRFPSEVSLALLAVSVPALTPVAILWGARRPIPLLSLMPQKEDPIKSLLPYDTSRGGQVIEQIDLSIINTQSKE
jgi:molybdopterin-guanine dinucleotide biosynthesis protein A